jgi:Tat protein secretion system quality control protein TatD with DNase activity
VLWQQLGEVMLPSKVAHRSELRFYFAGTGGIVHSFDGSAEEAAELLELGLYIGINGCSLRTDQNIEVVKNMPLDRIVAETDAPW